MNVSHPSMNSPIIQRIAEPGVDRTVRSDRERESSGGSEVKHSSLWEILTPEERAFFEQQASLGPITYRPGNRTTDGVPVSTGRRIDVRG